MKTVSFCGILYKVEMKRDGGGRLTLDFGRDAFDEIVRVQRYFVDNNVSVAIALEPYSEGPLVAHQEDTHKEASDDQVPAYSQTR